MAKVGQIVKENMKKVAADKLSATEGTFIVATVNRLSAIRSNELRQKLKAQNARLQVIKRRVGKRVLNDLNVEGLAQLADAKNGSLGLILPQGDPIPVAKQLLDFIKENQDMLSIQGGLLEGRLLSKKQVEEVAKLPSKPELLAQVIFTVEAPIGNLISLTEQLIGDVISCVDQIAQKKPSA